MPANLIFETEKFKWIDVLDLQIEEIRNISAEYDINHLLLEDCIDPNHLPKFEDLGDLKFLLTRVNTNTERLNLNTISDVSTKLGIFLKDNLILTVHRIENDVVSKLLKDLKEGKINDVNPYKIVLELAQNIFKSYEEENLILLEQMERMENEIFMKNISNATQIKRLYRFKRKVGLNQKVLNLSSEWVNSFDKLPLEAVEIKDLKDSYKDSLSDYDHLTIQTANLISMYLALSDQKANQVMKMLAIYSVYFLPITFIAGLYGMNFKFMPELEHPYGYFATLGVMVLIVIITFIYFRRKKW
ncbi:CorA family divalent cation transporter [Cloacibacterium sp.]|uniref:CorA family divalent cation transporter n=1 Tax=Cloacibacterium sp. TaxID=1913682 RepID=UPI0039E62FD7